jgi:NAD(P)-dependent dehydrogenase (short-subunit alcohol dehydrogenase family)
MTTYFITGANRGIGLEISRLALAQGHRVVATCREPSSAEALSALQGALEVHALDVTDELATQSLADRLKGVALDVLINNAGLMAEHQDIGDMDYAAWTASFVVNAMAPWRIAVTFASHLDASSRPCIVTLTSQMGSLERAGSDRIAYRSSKAAANMAMRTLAIEWRSRGIIVCALHPGWVRTDMGGSEAALSPVESATGLLQVIDGLTMSDSGCFLDYRGTVVPW